MQCKNHPKKEASAVCVECGKAVCNDCDFVLLRKRYCKECATKWLLGVDEALKLVTPDVVTCGICGRARGYNEYFHVCDRCGAVACPQHWYDGKRICQTCYDKEVDAEVKKWAKKGMTRPCPSCGVQNFLNVKTCRNRRCQAALPYLHDAVKIRAKDIPCANHPGKPAFVKCLSCSKYLCLECQTTYKSANYCAGCLATKKAAEAAHREKVTRRTVLGVAAALGAIGVTIGVVTVVSLITGLTMQARALVNDYAAAKTDYAAGRYEASLNGFRALGDYKEADKWEGAARIMLVRAEVEAAKASEAAGDFATAADHYDKAAAHDLRFKPSFCRCKARGEITVARVDLAEATILSDGINVRDAAAGRGGYEELCKAQEKAGGAVVRLDAAKKLAPGDAEVAAALVAARTEKTRLDGIRDRVEKRRLDIAAEEERKTEARRLAEERRAEAKARAEADRERRAAERERDDAKNYTIYVTDTGSKYHRARCRHLRKSRHPMKVKDARASGYSP